MTVAKAERSFSKLKIIKNNLRSSMGQERLSALALSSIENIRAQKINFSKVIESLILGNRGRSVLNLKSSSVT